MQTIDHDHVDDQEYVVPTGLASAAVLIVLADLARSVARVCDLMHAMARGMDAQRPYKTYKATKGAEAPPVASAGR
jgi:hypothetical protein